MNRDDDVEQYWERYITTQRRVRGVLKWFGWILAGAVITHLWNGSWLLDLIELMMGLTVMVASGFWKTWQSFFIGNAVIAVFFLPIVVVLGIHDRPKADDWQPVQRGGAIHIDIRRDHGYYVNLSVNDSPLIMPCRIDSGADQTLLPVPYVKKLWQVGDLNQADIDGQEKITLANGVTDDTTIFAIDKLIIHDDQRRLTVPRVKAWAYQIEHNESCLLGVSFFQSMKSWKIDLQRAELIMEW
jgi:hypothetical protein